MNITFLLTLFLFSLCANSLKAEGREDFKKPGIERNVLHRLRQLGLGGAVKIFSVSINGDHVYALPVLIEDKDFLWEEIHTNKSLWIKNPALFTRLFHGKGFESWRSAKKSSLHIIVRYLPDRTRYYEMHIDNWAPKGVKNPINSVRHIFAEVLWNAVTRRSANQKRIERGLLVIDEKNKRKP